MLDDLRASGVKHRVLFLEADEQTLLTRYKETRRRHPLAPTGSVADGIARERTLLAPLRERADVVIDTTGLTAAMLRRKLADELLPTRTPGRLAVTFESFGFKYGPVRDPDLMFDVRFLPNPHYEPELRPLTGTDPSVVEFINRDGELDAFYERLHPLLDYLLPQYLAEGKAHLGARDRLHRRPPPLGRDRRASRGALRAAEDEYLVEVVHRDVTPRPASCDDRPRRLRGLRSARARRASTTRSSSRSARGGCSNPSTRSPTGSTARSSGSSSAAGRPAPATATSRCSAERQGGGRRRPRRRDSPTAAVDDGAAGPATAVRPALLRRLPA